MTQLPIGWDLGIVIRELSRMIDRSVDCFALLILGGADENPDMHHVLDPPPAFCSSKTPSRKCHLDPAGLLPKLVWRSYGRSPFFLFCLSSFFLVFATTTLLSVFLFYQFVNCSVPAYQRSRIDPIDTPPPPLPRPCSGFNRLSGHSYT
ncbi:hypothetical protein CH063_15876, partial [Colletotrichum higginsianum]